MDNTRSRDTTPVAADATPTPSPRRGEVTPVASTRGVSAAPVASARGVSTGDVASSSSPVAGSSAVSSAGAAVAGLSAGSPAAGLVVGGGSSGPVAAGAVAALPVRAAREGAAADSDDEDVEMTEVEDEEEDEDEGEDENEDDGDEDMTEVEEEEDEVSSEDEFEGDSELDPTEFPPAYDPDAYNYHDPYGLPPGHEGYWGVHRPEESLFHRVETALVEYLGGERTPPFVRCPICTTTQLSIRGLIHYLSPDPDERAELPDYEPGVVLICGHMVCQPCWTLYAAQRNSQPVAERPPPRCPVCRVELEHTECGCVIRPVEMPMNAEDPKATEEYRKEWGHFCYRYWDDSWATWYPRTLAAGGRLPEKCERCAGR